MGTIHVQQIKSHLHSSFDGLIDLADHTGKDPKEVESAFLTRALAAFCVAHLADAPANEAADAVTDGFHDNGIDAIYFHEQEKILYVVQSKWRADGKGSVQRGEIQKFIKGFKDLINAHFDRFNPKVEARKTAVEKAISSADSRFMMVLAYSGQEPLAPEPRRDLEDLLAEMNDPSEILNLQVLKQDTLHRILASGAKGAPINFDVVIREWGQTREPYFAFYGQVAASEIAAWHTLHPRLFAPNIRAFLGSTEVNLSLMATLRSDPENFWYYNNGITVLCESIKKKPIGGSLRDTGTFECKGVSVVNGAQTVGAIAFANTQHPDAVGKASVLVRFISLENCPAGFSAEVTRATNTQNRIERRDFVALDPEQERIQSELQLDKIHYVYKSGERVQDPSRGFDFTEAAVAMACAKPDSNLAVQAKREIGKLWEDISKAPYKTLFNGSVVGNVLWFRVQVLREIETALVQAKESLGAGRDQMIPIHGNRFVAHCVFRKMAEKGLELPNGRTLAQLRPQIRQAVTDVLASLVQTTNKLYPDSYLAVLFKNAPKCKKIAKDMGF